MLMANQLAGRRRAHLRDDRRRRTAGGPDLGVAASGAQGDRRPRSPSSSTTTSSSRTSRSSATSSLGDLDAKFAAFGWHVVRADGHDLAGAGRDASPRSPPSTTSPRCSSPTPSRARACPSWRAPRSIPTSRCSATIPARRRPTSTGARSRRSRRGCRASPPAAGAGAIAVRRTDRPAVVADAGRKRAAVSRLYRGAAGGRRPPPRIWSRSTPTSASTWACCRSRRSYPERFVECGIAEQDMVSRAGGMALAGVAAGGPLVLVLPVDAAERADLQQRHRAHPHRLCRRPLGRPAGRARPFAPERARNLRRRRHAQSGDGRAVLPGGGGAAARLVPALMTARASCGSLSIPFVTAAKLPAGYVPKIGTGVTLRGGTDGVDRRLRPGRGGAGAGRGRSSGAGRPLGRRRPPAVAQPGRSRTGSPASPPRCRRWSPSTITFRAAGRGSMCWPRWPPPMWRRMPRCLADRARGRAALRPQRRGAGQIGLDAAAARRAHRPLPRRGAGAPMSLDLRDPARSSRQGAAGAAGAPQRAGAQRRCTRTAAAPRHRRRRRGRRRCAAARNGRKVVIATNNGGQFGLSAIDRLLAVALTLRGASVRTVLCDRALPACQMCETQSAARPGAVRRRGPSRLLCGYCHGPAAAAQRRLGLAAERLGDFITPEDRVEAERIARRPSTSTRCATGPGTACRWASTPSRHAALFRPRHAGGRAARRFRWRAATSPRR